MHRLLFALFLPLAACGEATSIESGEYQATWLTVSTDEGPVDLPRPDWRLSLSMAARTFHLRGTDFDLRGELMEGDQWVPDCPNDIAMTDQHVVRLPLSKLDVAGVVFEDPVLVATCAGHSSQTLVLQSAADVEAFNWPALFFEPVAE